VNLMLSAGADPELMNNNKVSPLVSASTLGHLGVVRALLAGGADPNLPGTKCGALHMATVGGHAEIARALRAAGARVVRETREARDTRPAVREEIRQLLVTDRTHFTGEQLRIAEELDKFGINIMAELHADAPLRREARRSVLSEPNVFAPVKPHDSADCAACGAVAAKHRCGVCKADRYCSRECQVMHWPAHKLECALKLEDRRVRAAASDAGQLRQLTVALKEGVRAGIESALDRTCVYCCGEGARSHCGACRTAQYCSTACQQQDWPNHKMACPGIMQLR